MLKALLLSGQADFWATPDPARRRKCREAFDRRPALALAG